MTLAIVAQLVLSRTMFGRWLYAIGTNPRAAVVSGVPARRVIVMTYMFSGFCAAIASVIYSSRMGMGRPTLGDPLLLDIIGGAVIGGTSLAGGKGKIIWTFFGVVFLSLLGNALSLLNVPFFYIEIVKGSVILFAALIDVLRRRMSLQALRSIEMSDPILQFQGVGKAFFGVPVLKDVSLDVERGQILGLVGENGAGKSTLMNILGGVVPAGRRPDGARRSGLRAARPARCRPRGHRLHPPGAEPLHEPVDRRELLHQRLPAPRPGSRCSTAGGSRRGRGTTSALVDLRVSPDMPVERLTPGERQLVEVAKALSVDARIIIFDEPTTSLTARETERLFDIIARLHATGETIIYISHILRDVLRLSNAIAVLRDGALVAHGPGATFTIHSMIASMVGRDIEDLYPERTSRPGEEVALEVRQLSKPGIVHEIDLQLHKGELLGVFGLMGSGRSELAQIIFGLEDADQGEVLINGQVARRLSPPRCIKDSMAFVTENRREEGLMMTATVADNLGLAALPEYSTRLLSVVKRGALGTAVRESVDTLRIKVHDAFRNQAKGLSGGNQQKVVLGKWLMTRPSILIIDEPTRGVDVGAKFELYTIIDRIAAEGTAVLFISSEIEELIGMCDRIIVMGHGEVLGSFTRAQFDIEQILRTAFREVEA